MKIIATAKKNYILEATPEEMAHLLGYGYTSQIQHKFEVGDEINLSRIFENLKRQDGMQRQLQEAQATLRACADMLDPVEKMALQCKAINREDGKVNGHGAG